MTFDDKSIKINANVPVTYVTCKFIKGKGQYGNWYRIDLYFKDEYNNQLVVQLFQPKQADTTEVLLEKIHYANVLKEVLDTLSQKPLWDTIPIGSWEDFYTKYLTLISPFRGKKCFLKTVPVKHWKEDMMTAGIADKNFISLSSDMEYTVLEESSADEYITEIIEVEQKHF